MEEFTSRVPWSRQPSLKTIANDLGVDFDLLIEGFAQEKSDTELAHAFHCSEKIIQHLREHFMQYGVGSIMGQD